MRSSRILSATSLVVGLLAIATLSVGAQSGTTLTVAQDGSGDFETISAAIEAASDGDTVLVSPGEYQESLFIDKDITLAGDGPRDQVLIAPASGSEVTFEAPWGDQIPTAVHFSEAAATVERLTFDVSGDRLGILLEGGKTTISDTAITGNDVLMLGGEPVFRDSVIDAYFAVRDGASPLVEDSELLGHASVDGPGETIIRRSTLRGGTSASDEATGAYEDNLFEGEYLAVDSGSHMLIKGNILRDVPEREAAIQVHDDGSSAEIVGNTITGAAVGISVNSANPDSSIVENTINDVRIGIAVDSDGATLIKDNTITDVSGFGLVLVGGEPVVVGNSICGSGEPFELRGGTDPQIGTNEVCEVDQG